MNPVIQPDLLVEFRTLPLAALIVLTALGIGLIATGWLLQRFWITLTFTFLGGLIGLQLGPRYGLPAIVASLLAAVAAGALALALARICVFFVYGKITCMVVATYAPRFDVPYACFFAGGLGSVLAYRLAVRLLTVAVGCLALIYGGVVLAEKIGKFDSAAYVGKIADKTLHVTYLGMLGTGTVSQMLVDHYWGRYQKNRKDLQALRQKQPAAKPAGGGGKTKAMLGWFRKAA